MLNRRRYAIVGTGDRCVTYVDALAGDYRDHAQLAGLCDTTPARMQYYNRYLETTYKHAPVSTYLANDFDRMIAEQKPQTVIVTSPDWTHDKYIIRAMQLGCDVVCEKPMAIDGPRVRAVLETIVQTGRSLRATFNVRYAPPSTKLRELLMDGIIGKPLAVNFNWVLDTRHGADYFRRWHAEKVNSGGLLVHKASHHFDLINWWIDSYPRRVFAMGDLKFYGRNNAEARGEKYDYDRSLNQPKAAGDPFALQWDKHPTLRDLYAGEAEKQSGYLRDRNVFGDHVTIEDTLALTATYRNGVILSYSLLAYSPWEGFRVSVTGDKGRIELSVRRSAHIVGGESDPKRAFEQPIKDDTLTVFPMFQTPYRVDIPKLEGGHDGGDPLMLDQIFSPSPPPDTYHRAASHIDGAAACLLGIAANQSIVTGLPVDLDDICKLP